MKTNIQSHTQYWKQKEIQSTFVFFLFWRRGVFRLLWTCVHVCGDQRSMSYVFVNKLAFPPHFADRVSHGIWSLLIQGDYLSTKAQRLLSLPLVTGLQACAATFCFYMRARDLDSGPPACVPNTYSHFPSRVFSSCPLLLLKDRRLDCFSSIWEFK